MHTIRPGEDAEQRNRRVERETAQLNAAIARRDADTVPTMAEKVAIREMENRSRRMPHDYAAIMKYRAECPGLFVHLPSDDECRRQLGITSEPEALATVEEQRRQARKGKGF